MKGSFIAGLGALALVWGLAVLSLIPRDVAWYSVWPFLALGVSVMLEKVLELKERAISLAWASIAMSLVIAMQLFTDPMGTQDQIPLSLVIEGHGLVVGGGALVFFLLWRHSVVQKEVETEAEAAGNAKSAE